MIDERMMELFEREIRPDAAIWGPISSNLPIKNEKEKLQNDQNLKNDFAKF